MAQKAKVSVVCISYNQEKFIRQALEGFVSQKTSFTFEIIVADDYSTDSTQEIIKEYSSKYPDLFKAILRTENVGVQRNLKSALMAAEGEYIALCEGDDYWTDNEKLQKQADFLDKHKDCALCFHPVKVVFDGGELSDAIYPEEVSGFTLKKLLERNFIQTNSVMYRRQEYGNLPENILPLDWYLHLYHAQFGNIGFIDRNMAVYRRHPGGIWWDSFKDPSLIWKNFGDKYLLFLHSVMDIYGSDRKYREIIVSRSIADVFESMSQLPPEFIDEVAVKSIKLTSREVWYYIKSLIGQVQYHAGQSTELAFKLKQESMRIKEKDQEIQQLTDRLNEITTSRAWKLIVTHRKVKSHIKKIAQRSAKTD